MIRPVPLRRSSHHPLPNPNTYWVAPGKLLAGEYPGHENPAAARARLRKYLAAGVTFFLDLTEPGELRPYEGLLRTESASQVRPARYQRRPIRDASIPRSAAYLVEILDLVDQAISDRQVVYVHCWGGIGRTGLVVGCHLVRHGKSGAQALRSLARLWQTVEKSAYCPHSPETEEQSDYVLHWQEPTIAARRAD